MAEEREHPREPRVGVVLLTFNCAHRLDEVLDRLTALQVPVVAVDNGSTDGTAEVLRRRKGIDVVALPDNLGAAARDVGARRLDTPYLAFCDDDGWYEADGLDLAADLLDAHPRLAVVNARILVGPSERLDPISAEMAESPLPDRDGIPGAVLLGFMGGAVVVRRAAWLGVGGYDPRFFIGGEEETVSLQLLRHGWQMRYVPEVVVHHLPSRANFHRLRAYGFRNTIVNAWLHRPAGSALRWTVHTLLDRPKDRDWLRGVGMVLRSLPWIVAERSVMPRQVDDDLRLLNDGHYRRRRPLLTRHYGGTRRDEPTPEPAEQS